MNSRKPTGEMKVSASSDGRVINRQNITASSEYEQVKFHRTDGTPPLFAGLQVEWVSGSEGKTQDEPQVSFNLTAGAGVASKYMVLSVTLPDGTQVYEYVDIFEVAQNRVLKIQTEHEAMQAIKEEKT